MMAPTGDGGHTSTSKMKQRIEGDDSLSLEPTFRMDFFFPLRIKESGALPFKHHHVPLLKP